MKVYFLRHGNADVGPEWQGPDEDRPLSKLGVVRTRDEASVLAAMRLPLDRIITSPLSRARQTAEIVARKMRLADALVVDERLAPGFGTAELAAILKENEQLDSLVGWR